jgi:hypothetical protein
MLRCTQHPHLSMAKDKHRLHSADESSGCDNEAGRSVQGRHLTDDMAIDYRRRRPSAIAYTHCLRKIAANKKG